MNGRHRQSASWATYVGGIALVGVGALGVAGLANAQPVPHDPAVPVIPTLVPPPPPPAPIPVGAPYVPPVPGSGAPYVPPVQGGAAELLPQGEIGPITDILGDFRSPDMFNTLFPAPAAPPTPVREMPYGPPPPLDPAFLPPT